MSGRGVRDGLLRRSPLQAVSRRRNRDRLGVLAYHGVPDAGRFEAHVRHLVRARHPVGLDAVLRVVAEPDGDGLPHGAVLVTFDDGDPSVVEVAAPILARYGVPAVAFVVTDVVGTDAVLWWTEVEARFEAGARVPGLESRTGRGLVDALKRVPDSQRRALLAELRSESAGTVPRQRQLGIDDLRALEAAGVEVGSHSADHPCLDRVDDAGVRDQLRRSREALEGWLGHPPRAFAYPNGDHDARVRGLVAAAGYDAAFAFDHQLADVPPVDRFAISRLRVDAQASVDRLALLLSGLHSSVHRRLGRP